MALPTKLARVVEPLFPEADPPIVTLRTVLMVVGALVTGTIVLLLRQTGAGALNTLYAEDGQIFLGEAVRRPGIEALTSSYVGYFHLVPRVLAELASTVPLSRAAATLAMSSAAFVVSLALVVYRASAAHIRSAAVRAVLASAMVLLPVAQEEVFNNAANIHWFLIFAAAWVLLWHPRTRWELSVGAIVLLLAGLSDPLTALLGPIALLRLIALRGWRPHLLTAAFAVGVGGQLLAIVLSGAERSGLSPDINVVKAVGQYGFYVVARGTFGTRALEDTGGGRTAALGIVALCLLALVAVVAVIRARQAISRVAPVLAAISGLFYLATVLVTGISPPRYGVVPILLLFSAVALLVDGCLAARPDGVSRAMATMVILVVVVTWTANYREDNRRSTGRRWGTELARARESCGDSGRSTVRIPISPETWRVVLPCRELAASATDPGT